MKFFNCYNQKDIKLMTQLPLGLSHPRENKFNHNFRNCKLVGNEIKRKEEMK